eukprot:357606-Chlamydomonas_euryale.AAC.11
MGGRRAGRISGSSFGGLTADPGVHTAIYPGSPPGSTLGPRSTQPARVRWGCERRACGWRGAGMGEGQDVAVVGLRADTPLPPKAPTAEPLK